MEGIGSLLVSIFCFSTSSLYHHRGLSITTTYVFYDRHLYYSSVEARLAGTHSLRVAETESRHNIGKSHSAWQCRDWLIGW